MPRLMSVAMTVDAVRARTKDVTRRLGWEHAVPGMQLTLCEKVQGRSRRLPDGTRVVDPLVRVDEVEVVSVRREPLSAMLDDLVYGMVEVRREGFVRMDPAEFVRRFFVDAQGCTPDTVVTRIEWRYLLPREYGLQLPGGRVVVGPGWGCEGDVIAASYAHGRRPGGDLLVRDGDGPWRVVRRLDESGTP